MLVCTKPLKPWHQKNSGKNKPISHLGHVFIQQVQKCLLLKPLSRHGELLCAKWDKLNASTAGSEASCLDATAIACKSCCLTLILPESGLYMFGTSQLENQVLQCWRCSTGSKDHWTTSFYLCTTHQEQVCDANVEALYHQSCPTGVHSP